MANFDLIEFEHFYNFFPEFTSTQTENVLLFSVGLSPTDIAAIRHVSVGSVRKSLSEAQQRLSLYSLHALRSVVQLRLLLPVITSYPAGVRTRMTSASSSVVPGALLFS